MAFRIRYCSMTCRSLWKDCVAQRPLRRNALQIFLKRGQGTSTSSDPYKVLKIGRDANETTIKNAYIRLSKHYHPDINPGDENAAEMFLRVQNSYREIMRHVKDLDPNDEDEKHPSTTYSATIEPLGVETAPPIPVYRRPFVSSVLSIIVFMILIIVMDYYVSMRVLKEEKPKDEVVEEVIQEYMASIRYQDQKDRKCAKIIENIGESAGSLIR